MAVENRKANAAAFLFLTSLIASFPATARDSSKAIKRCYKVCDNRGSGHVMKTSWIIGGEESGARISNGLLTLFIAIQF